MIKGQSGFEMSAPYRRNRLTIAGNAHRFMPRELSLEKLGGRLSTGVISSHAHPAV
jgi:hypothetical protein